MVVCEALVTTRIKVVRYSIQKVSVHNSFPLYINAFSSLEDVTNTSNLMVCCIADMNPTRKSMTFHARSCVYGVTKETVSWHLCADHPRHHRPSMNAHSNLIGYKIICQIYLRTTLLKTPNTNWLIRYSFRFNKKVVSLFDRWTEMDRTDCREQLINNLI